MRCPQKEILQAFLITAPKRIGEGEGQMGVGKGREEILLNKDSIRTLEAKNAKVEKRLRCSDSLKTCNLDKVNPGFFH